MACVDQYQDIGNLREKFRKWDVLRQAGYIAHVQKLAATQPEKFPLFVKLTLEYTTIRMER